MNVQITQLDSSTWKLSHIYVLDFVTQRLKEITYWIASSLGMKSAFNVMNQKPNGVAYSGSIHCLLVQKKRNHVAALCRKALVESVLWVQGPKLEIDKERGIAVTSVNYCDMLRNELWSASCTKQTGWLSQMFCYMTMHALVRHTSPPTTFSHWTAKFSGICPQPKSGLLRFPFIWTPQEHSKLWSICRWWRGERSGAWPASS